MFNRRMVNNAYWIIGCKIVQSILQFVVGIITARFLGPSNYGIINYAASLTAFMVPIMNLGMSNVLVQELVIHPEEEGKILGSSILLSFCSAILCMFGIATFSLVVNRNEPLTILVCILFSIQLLFQSIELILYWFQAKLLSKYTSIISLIAYGVVSAYKIYLLANANSVQWFAVCNSIEYLTISLGALFAYRKLGGQKLRFSASIGKRVFEKSHYYILSSLMVTIFTQTDRIMIKQMLGSTETGYYAAAVTCASISSFVFAAIIDSVRPVAFSDLEKSIEKFNKVMINLYNIIIYLSLLQSIFMTLLASIIIYILYGESYNSAVPVLQVIVWYTTFSYIGSVRNVWILAREKQKYLWVINLSGAVLNVLLNLVFIKWLGVVGAAIASLATQFFSNVVIGFIIPELRENNVLILKSLNPQITARICSSLIQKRR